MMSFYDAVKKMEKEKALEKEYSYLLDQGFDVSRDFEAAQANYCEDELEDSISDSYTVLRSYKEIRDRENNTRYIILHAKIKADDFSVFWHAFITEAYGSGEKQIAELTFGDFRSAVHGINNFFKSL